MIARAKTALIAAFVLGSASAALAQASGDELQNSQYLNNPAAPVPLFQQYAYTPPAAGLIEGRNVYEGVASDTMRAAPIEWMQVAQANPYSRNYANRSPLESFGGY